MPRPIWQPDPEVLADMIAMYQAGASPFTIGQQIGRSESCVRRTLVHNGVKMRTLRESMVHATSEPTLREAIEARVKMDPETECWTWVGHRCKGRLRFMWNGKIYYARRVVLQEFRGQDVTKKYRTAVLCGNDHCVSPLHIAMFTRSVAHMFQWERHRARNTMLSAAAGGRRKLDLDKVRTIRAWVARGERISVTAAHFRVDRHTVGKIVSGQTWKDPAMMNITATEQNQRSIERRQKLEKESRRQLQKARIEYEAHMKQGGHIG